MPRIEFWVQPAAWIAWSAYWVVAARGAKPVRARESIASRASHIAPLAVAFLLLALPRLPLAGLDTRLLRPPLAWFWAGSAATVAGLLYAAWARVHLGGNWSGTVTIKEGHALVTSGPYAYTRHPIYTGLLLAFIGSALARGELRGLLSVAIAAAAFQAKLRIEERWLGQEFGEAYAVYRGRVPALIPRVL